MKFFVFAFGCLFLLLGASGCPLVQSPEDTSSNDQKQDPPLTTLPKNDESETKGYEPFSSFAECVKNGGTVEELFPSRKCILGKMVAFEYDSHVFPQEHLRCETDADCVPYPECHARACLNADFLSEYPDQPEICTMLFDNSAAYSPEDCLCQTGFCTNKNASGNSAFPVDSPSECSQEENLVCGQTAYCECRNNEAVSMTPIDVDKPCMRGCEKVIKEQTYLNECVMKEAGAVLVAEVECLQLESGSIEEEDTGASDSQISSFEECVTAGNPVMESYPRQCRTSDGEFFIEEISE
jgi:hypothetical protein